ncbi:hypothetical protein COW36_01660 [bacterium (Candidatus Blackallbacteria) CG17_big_fil_post_rev_8_21_14_2_50_48_46]|uniref:Uncharacterized protein n=1 Tax=bacterium (Candidatus Blackallbacteria) CG17_big_fil_post_rev_8_21_14_2_50_48_46 TaxID=2014261 RepID=A0A2M7GBK2_9BACT|nr:MAG: hypothetical protein COW64_09515 [bacterium (Candidatus Blackallbacteria) CG18_big_fil_WC_8_21_14_2_50_49_26]PIW19572.1 MAG: hypothetical protein COW36_01660 [bacterium (Candidatus Blackallbacteria) CG17_big_fil_post_rev_8_21_14_2_50_48_46]PIW48825.1 MAG: hypothetical protein COW20_06795 [bacterium (Candidatus Blackallbacteria) CG13_big_fil_rev_8_21_14_2_50_49_14]
MRYTTLAREAETEIIILKSRFIASGCEVQTVEAAEAFLHKTRERWPDATHHCYAFRVGGPPLVDRYSDDGEPSGTAGKPIMTVLEHNLYNAILVVTRYFGGTKLGTGGLVKAYTQAAQALIETAGRLEKEPCLSLELHYPYALSGTIEYQLAQAGLKAEFTYSADVQAQVEVPLSQKEQLLAQLSHPQLLIREANTP